MFTPKMKMSCCDRLDWVPLVTKTRKDNDMINQIGLLYSKSETQLSGPI